MEFISTGSTLLNLVLSGRIDGGWPVGRVSNLVGDKATGKTLIAIESAINFLRNPPRGATARVLYVETESAFDLARAKDLGMPEKGFEVVTCPTIEGLHDLVGDLVATVKKKEYVFLIVDSLDALASESEQAKKIREGSYRMMKQRLLGVFFQDYVSKLTEKNITPLFISQIRHNLDAGAFGKKYRRAGGRALDFYCSIVQWLYYTGKVKHPKTGLIQGASCKTENTKNKVSMPLRTAEFDIIYSYGMDDTTSMVEFISSKDVPAEYRVIRRHTGGHYEWDSHVALDEKIKIDALVEKIESDKELTEALRQAVGNWWLSREDIVATDRKKYT